jgi:galactonate dehydratase
LTEPIEVDEDGYIPLPEGLGLGIELDEDQLEDKLGHDWNYPKTYDADDGSVVNW